MRGLVLASTACVLLALGNPSAGAQPTPPAAGAPASFGERPEGAPVAVLAVGCADCAAEAVEAMVNATVAALGPLVQDRRVVAGAAQAERALSCTEPTCVGTLVAEAGAIAGVILRLSRARRRDPISVSLEVVDPVSGHPRGGSASATVAPDALEPIAAMAAEIRGLLPAPPPRSTLLMAVNVEGAAVTINDRPVGEAPLAPIDLPPGRYRVQAVREGYGDAYAEVTIAQGESARVNLDLTRGGVSSAAVATAGEGEADEESPFYTRWYVLTGAGVVVVGAAVLIAVVAGGGDDEVAAIAVPPIE